MDVSLKMRGGGFTQCVINSSEGDNFHLVGGSDKIKDHQTSHHFPFKDQCRTSMTMFMTMAKSTVMIVFVNLKANKVETVLRFAPNDTKASLHCEKSLPNKVIDHL